MKNTCNICGRAENQIFTEDLSNNKQAKSKQTQSENSKNRPHAKIIIPFQCQLLHGLMWTEKETYLNYMIYGERMGVNVKKRSSLLLNNFNWKVLDLKKQWKKNV